MCCDNFFYKKYKFTLQKVTGDFYSNETPSRSRNSASAAHLHRRDLPIAHPRNPIPQTPSCEPAITQAPSQKTHLGKFL